MQYFDLPALADWPSSRGLGSIRAREDGTFESIWAVAAISAWVVWRMKVHLLWLLGAGAVLGWFGLI